MDGKSTRCVRRQNTEQSPPGGHPCERPLQHANKQTALLKLPHDERCKRPVALKIGAEQDAAGLDSPNAQNVLEESRRHMQHRNRLAHERQRGGQPLECFRVLRHRQVACPSPRSGPKLGQMRRQPLLQLARAAGSHQCRSWWASADIDKQAGTIRL
jgi:hypothetical protein